MVAKNTGVQPSGKEIMDKPLPELLDEIINNQKAAEEAKNVAMLAASEALESAKTAVAEALNDLMNNTINPLTADLNDLKKLFNDNFAKAQVALDSNNKLAKEAMQAAIVAAKSAQEARDAYKALQDAHNDLTEKFNNQTATLTDLIGKFENQDKAIKVIMTANVNAAYQQNIFYKQQYKPFGVS